MSDPYSNDDDLTGGGSYLPSLPKLYQSILGNFISGPDQNADMIKPPEAMQSFYNKMFSAMGFPDSPQNPNRTMPARSAVRGVSPPPQSNFPSRPQAVAPNPYVTDMYSARPQMVAPSSYTTDNFPNRPTADMTAPRLDTRTSQVPLRGSTPSTFGESTGRAHAQAPYKLPDEVDYTGIPRAMSDADFYNARPILENPSAAYSGIPRKMQEADLNAQTPIQRESTGRAHLSSPIIPKNAAASTGRAHMSTSSQDESDLPASKEAEDTGPFLNNDPNDMRPGSLGEAKKLFPGRPLQQAIYYTDPTEKGGGQMRRLGVGADTSKLNPDYIARIWEPADMSGGEKLIRGAFETPGKNPITYTPGKASGGSIDAAHKIANQKATPCHVGFINAAVGGRTDHLPMHVLENSYVVPAAEVGALGQGNSLAGAKILDGMFGHENAKSQPAHKAIGGGAAGTPMKSGYLSNQYTLPEDVKLGVDAPSFSGANLIKQGFSTGPFGLSQQLPKFSALDVPKPPTDLESLSDRLRQNKQGTAAPQAEAHGGPIMSGNHRPVPIVAAGGEYVIHPDMVRKLGGGDIKKGHDYLDNFVKYVRQHTIKTLQKLPGPRRD